MWSQDISHDGSTPSRTSKDTYNPLWYNELCQMEVSRFLPLSVGICTDWYRENQSHFQGTLLQKVHSQTERWVSLCDKQTGSSWYAGWRNCERKLLLSNTILRKSSKWSIIGRRVMGTRWWSRSKAEADKPKIEEAKQVNEVMRADMAKLHIDQAAVANRNEELKRERTILQDRTVSPSTRCETGWS